MLTVRVFSQCSFQFSFQFSIRNEPKIKSKIEGSVEMGLHGSFSWKAQFQFHFWLPFSILIWSWGFNADFQLPPLHHSPYPCIWLVFVIVIDVENPNHLKSSHQEWPSSPPSSPDYQLPSQATVCGGAGRPGMMGRSGRHDNDSRDRETATPRRRRGRGGEGGGDKGVDAPKMIACGILHGGSMFLFHSN